MNLNNKQNLPVREKPIYIAPGKKYICKKCGLSWPCEITFRDNSSGEKPFNCIISHTDAYWERVK